MNAKTNRKSKKADVAAVVETVETVETVATVDVAAFAAQKRDSLLANAETIKTQSAELTDADALAKSRLAVCNAESRASRSNKVVVMSDADAATFALFVKMHDTEEKIARFFARAIYVQDKLRAIIAATARGLSLSNITRNRSTVTVIRELLSGNANRKTLMSAIVRDCEMTHNTASSQVSSSLIALAHCGIVAQDSATKEYRIADEDHARLLAA